MISKLKAMRNVLHITGMWTVVKGFVCLMLIATLIIHIVEPDINSYLDALWYIFASVTTIGYGDFVAQTIIGRAVTIVISLYGILVLAFIPAVIVSYYMERNKRDYPQKITYKEISNSLGKLTREELVQLKKDITSKMTD